MTRRVVFTVPDAARRDKCRSCGASIAWITTPAGKYMPVALALAERNLVGELEAPSHFADCPGAALHRRAR